MNVPADLRYTKDHEWARQDGEMLTVGITDYAQDALGDVVFVRLPNKGEHVDAQSSLSEIESTKSVSDVYAPVAGTIEDVNSALAEHPELVNADPYNEGWICTIHPDDAAAYDALLDAASYGEITAD